jgi:hypothetical protein
MDEKALKALADMLALVVDDNEHVSQSALLKIRQRARQDGVTGGALKNLVALLATPGGPPRFPGAQQTVDQNDLYSAIAAVQEQNARLRKIQAGLAAENRQLRFSLSLAELRLHDIRREYVRLSQQRPATGARTPRRFKLLTWGAMVWGPVLGLLVVALLFQGGAALAPPPETRAVILVKPAPAARLASLPAVSPAAPFLAALWVRPLVHGLALPPDTPPAPSRITVNLQRPILTIAIPALDLAVEPPLILELEEEALAKPVVRTHAQDRAFRAPAFAASALPLSAVRMPSAGGSAPAKPPLAGSVPPLLLPAAKSPQRRMHEGRAGLPAPHRLAA